MTKKLYLPYDGYVPELPGRTNTTELHITYSESTHGFHIFGSGNSASSRPRGWRRTFGEALLYRSAVLSRQAIEPRTVTITSRPSVSRSDFDDLNDPQEAEWYAEGGLRTRRARQAELRVRAEATGLFGPGDELAPRGKSRKELLGDIDTAFMNGGRHVFIEKGMQRKADVQDWADMLGILLVTVDELDPERDL